MELYIDDQKVDTDLSTRVSVSLSVAAVTDPRKGRAGYTRTMQLPMTALNDQIFGFAGEIHAKERFNAAEHSGRVEHEGATLIEGPVFLSRVQKSTEAALAKNSQSNSHGFYEVYIIGAAKEWVAKASAKSLGSTSVTYSRAMTGPNILAGWTDSAPVKFLPVARETQQKDQSSGNIIPRMKILSSDDYHPFIHAGTLLKRIFAENGYTVVSNFVDSQPFSQLYISGRYKTSEPGALKADMDFLARKVSNASSTANYMGRVYADPYVGVNSVGNIVDTAQIEETASKTTHNDVFTHNGCFQKDDKRVAFVPTSECSVGFQYHIAYTSQYRIKNRSELAGFNRIYLGEVAQVREFSIANPYVDRRPNLRPFHSYKAMIFNHNPNYQYQLRFTSRTAGGALTIHAVPLGSKLSSFTTPSAAVIESPVIQYRPSSIYAWATMPVTASDWAIYDGFIEESGDIDLEITLRTAPETISPSRPKFFDSIFFEGAESGMRLTLSDRSWVRPIFYAQPSEGLTLSFADVCAHQTSQMDFINSLRQMFNLCFQTDNRERAVRVEPAESFFDASRVIDLTGRVDLSRPVEIEELGGDLAREMAWSYRGGDGAVASFNRANGGQLGRWSAVVEGAADHLSEWENPLFTPSLNTDDAYAGAPSALLIRVGDDTPAAESPERTENLNFLPKIVRYEGLASLPQNESWGWPLSAASYPKAAFHAPESGYTLCFEDRDGCTGLHSRWERDLRLWNHSRRITAWLTLSAADIASLAFPAGGEAGFGALYRIVIDGEQCVCRLEEVCDYSPGAASTKCVLIKHIP